MIEGLRLDITGGELQARLDERIELYRGRTDGLVAQMDRLSGPGMEDTRDDDEPPSPFLCRSDSPVRATQRRLERLQNRIVVLTFLREHLVRDETYRLDVDDLEELEIVPERSPFA